MFDPKQALAPEHLRRLAVRMAIDGDPPEQVADVLGVSERSVWRWVAAWRAGGEAGLATRPGQGRPPKLTDRRAAAVLGWVRRSPAAFGFATERWTAPRVAAVIGDRFGVRLNHRYLNDWLGRHGVTPQVPERRPRERDDAAIAAWVAGEWPALKKGSATAARP